MKRTCSEAALPALGVVLEHRGGLVGGVEVADHGVEDVVATRVERAEPRGRSALPPFPSHHTLAGLRDRVGVLEQRLGAQDLDEQRVAVARDRVAQAEQESSPRRVNSIASTLIG